MRLEKTRFSNLAAPIRTPEGIAVSAYLRKTNAVCVKLDLDRPSKGGFKTQVSPRVLKTIPWKIMPSKCKIQCGLEWMLANDDRCTYHMSINLSPRIQDKLRNGQNLEYIRTEIRRILKRIIRDTPLYFYLVLEDTNGKLHLHGAISLTIEEALWVNEIWSEIASSSLCNGYSKRWKNKRVVINRTWIRKYDPFRTKRPVDSNWGLYSLKNFGSKGKFLMSTELRAAANQFVDYINRSKLSSSGNRVLS